MIFWDTSALVPLLVREPASDRMRALATDATEIVVWWGTSLEVLSAFARREREGTIRPREVQQSRAELQILRSVWTEIHPSEKLHHQTSAILLRHPLKSADALQLGAALTWAQGSSEDSIFLTLDRRLARAAESEGFDLVVPLEDL